MSWLNFGNVKDNVSSLTGQISSFTREVLTEGTEEVYDHEVELKIAKGKVSELENRLIVQKSEWERCSKRNEELQEKSESSDLQIRALKAEYRQQLEEKDSTIKELEQSFSELQRSSFSRTRNDSSSKDNVELEDLEFLQHQLSNLKQKTASLEAECQHWKEAAAGNTSEAQLRPLQERHRQEIASLQDMHSQKIHAMKMKHRSELEDMEHDKADLENQIRDLQEFNNSWDDGQESANNSMPGASPTAVEERLHSELSDQSVLLVELQEKYQKALGDCQKAKDNCLDLDVELEATLEKLDVLSASNSELQSRIEFLESALETETASKHEIEVKLDDIATQLTDDRERRTSSGSSLDSKEGGFVKVDVETHDVGCQATIEDGGLHEELENVKDENISLSLELNKLKAGADVLMEQSHGATAGSDHLEELQALKAEIDRLAACTVNLLDELNCSRKTGCENEMEIVSLGQICQMEEEPIDELTRLQHAIEELGERYADLLHFYRQVRIELQLSNERLLAELQRNHNETLLLRQEVSRARDKLATSADAARESYNAEHGHADAVIAELNDDVVRHRGEIVAQLEERSHQCTGEMLVACTSDASCQVDAATVDESIVASLCAEKAILERTIEGLERKTENLESLISKAESNRSERGSSCQDESPRIAHQTESEEFLAEDGDSHEGLAFDDNENMPSKTPWQQEKSRVEELEMTLGKCEEELQQNEAVRQDWEVEKQALEAAVIELQRKCKETLSESSCRDVTQAEKWTSTDHCDGSDAVAACIQLRPPGESAHFSTLLSEWKQRCGDTMKGRLADCGIEFDVTGDDDTTEDADAIMSSIHGSVERLANVVVSTVNDSKVLNEALSGECETLRRENDEIKSYLTESNSTMKKLQEELDVVTLNERNTPAEIDDVRSSLAETEHELEETRLELTSSRSELQRITERVQDAEEEILALTESSETLQQDADALTQTNAALTSEKEQLQSELDKLQFQMDTNETDDSSEISEMKAQLTEMKSEREHLVAMINERDSNIMELQDRYDNVIAGMESERSRDILVLEEQNEAITTMFQQEKAARQQVEIQLHEKQAELEELSGRVNALGDDVEKPQTANERPGTNPVDEVSYSIGEGDERFHNETASLKLRIVDMEERLIGIEDDPRVSDASVDKKAWQEEVSHLMDVIRSKDEQLVDLQQSTVQPTADARQPLDSTMATQLHDSRQQLAFMEEKTTSMEEIVKHYSVQVDLLKEERQTALQMLNVKRSEVDELMEQLETVSSRAAAKDHASSLLHGEHQKLMELNKMQGDEIARLRERIHHLQLVVEERQAEHGSHQHLMDEHSDLLAQIAALQGDEERLLGLLHEKDTAIRSATELYQNLEEKYQSALTELSFLERSITLAAEAKVQLEVVENPSTAESRPVVEEVLVRSSDDHVVSAAVEDGPALDTKDEASINPSASVDASLAAAQEEVAYLKGLLQDGERLLSEMQQSHTADVNGLRNAFENTTLQKDQEIKSLEGRLQRTEEQCRGLRESLQQSGKGAQEIESLLGDIGRLKDDLVSKENELQAHRVTNEKLREVVSAGESALAKIQEDNRHLTIECQSKDDSIASVQSTCAQHEQKLRENETEIHRYKVSLLECEARTSQETQRLRNHLLEIEEGYTGEAIAAQQREEELQEKHAVTTAELERVTVLLQQTNQHSHDGMQSLEEQLQVIASQRDNALLQLSKADDKAEETAAALNNLQFALEQLQKDKDGQYDMLSEQYQKLLVKSQKDSEEMKVRDQECQARLQEAALAVQGASSMTSEFQRKEEMLQTLKEEVAFLKQDSSAKEELLRRLKDSADGKVDKPLIKNLLIGYFHAPEGKRPDVVRVIGSLVGFSIEEIQTIGSGAPPSKLGGGWVSGILSFGGGQPARRPSRSNDSQVDLHGQSFSEMFVNFLEQESFTSGLGPGPNRSNALLGASLDSSRGALTPSKPTIVPSTRSTQDRRISAFANETPFSQPNASNDLHGSNGAPVLFPAPGQEIPRVHTSTANSALQSMLS